MTTRRHVLQVLAAAPALAACGGGPDQGAAWRDPGAGESDPRRFALAHAILAPNPHNTQAWSVALEGDDAMLLYCDLDRRLPFTDPNDRQITLGCGCFLELYRIAASSLGRAVEFDYFPEGAPAGRLDARPLARARIQPQANAAADPLFAFITARRTNRHVYDAERIPSDLQLARIASTLGGFFGTAQWTAEPREVEALRDLVWRAFEREMATEGAQRETYRWLRFGREQAARRGDGLLIDSPMLPLVKALGFLDEEDFLDPDSFANQSAAEDWRRKAETARAFMWLTSGDDAPQTRLIAGRAYARMNLVATAMGLAMHPWSQALQEYEAMADLYDEARDLLDANRQTVQMLVRVGYAAPAPASARRGVEAMLRG